MSGTHFEISLTYTRYKSENRMTLSGDDVYMAHGTRSLDHVGAKARLHVPISAVHADLYNANPIPPVRGYDSVQSMGCK